MTPEELIAFARSDAGLCAARDYLSGYLRLDAMIAVKLARLDQMKARAARMAPLHPGPEEETAALEADILSDYTALTRRQRDIAAVIRAVPDERHRTVLEMRYLEGLPFFRIAMRMNYAERQIYRYHRRGLMAVAARIALKEI